VNEPGVVAVTGLRTFVGRGVVDRLLARPAAPRIVGLDWRRPFRLDERVRFHRIDLTEPTADCRFAEIFERERVEAVVHAAFRTNPSSDLEQDHELETIGSLHVMHACAAVKVRRLVVASSTMLYGPWPDNPNFLSEEHPLRGHPDAHAVRDRIEMETLLSDWCARHPDAEVTVLRPCWIAGPTYWNHIVRYFALPVVPKPMGYDPLFQFVHEDDVLDAFERNYPTRSQTGDPPAAFFDYLRYLWVADGQRGWDAFGEPVYTTKEAWISFVSSRRMRRYR
jgi:UDP-glucose 4-epimerase